MHVIRVCAELGVAALIITVSGCVCAAIITGCRRAFKDQK